jgi:hypothetical protein
MCVLISTKRMVDDLRTQVPARPTLSGKQGNSGSTRPGPSVTRTAFVFRKRDRSEPGLHEQSASHKRATNVLNVVESMGTFSCAKIEQHVQKTRCARWKQRDKMIESMLLNLYYKTSCNSGFERKDMNGSFGIAFAL